MRKNEALFSFPFQKITNFLETGIDKKLEEFYNSFKNEFFGYRIKKIDLDKREVQFYRESYSDGELEYSTQSFETEIKFYIINLVYKSFDVIAEGVNICFISNQSTLGYLEKLDGQYKMLLSHTKNVDFPFLIKYLHLIGEELNHYKNLVVSKENAELPKDSPFKQKDSIKASFFHRLYEIAIRHNLIEDGCSKYSFIDVFIRPSTQEKITFNCNNPLWVSLFEIIRICFNNLNPTSVGKSGRFLTKQKVPFTSGTYSTTKQRIKVDYRIKELTEDLAELVSDFK